MNINALSAWHLARTRFLLLFPTKPSHPLYSPPPIVFFVWCPSERLCQRQERGLLFCFSATYIYLFIPLIAIMRPIHSYHNSPAFSADG